MTFYDDLSRYYDEIFPVDAAEMAFVSGQVAGKRRLLDVGCGTGNKTVHCAAKDVQVTGIDRDPAMITRAKTDNARSNISYEVLDMSLLGVRYAPGSFDAAVCLGNTLVHLADRAAIDALLGDLGGLLAAEGVAVIQILNYDRILDGHITSLPDLESEHALFTRSYEAEGPLLRFITRLTEKSSGRSLDNAVPLYPLRREELARGLAAAGFHTVEWYGNYRGDPLTADSFALIAVCRK